MITRFSKFKGQFFHVKLNFSPKTYIKSVSLNSQPYGYHVYQLTHDLKAAEKETNDQYNIRSLDEFKKLLNSNTYYTFLQHTRIQTSLIPPYRNSIAEAGHIAGFLTDTKGNVIQESVMSVRNNSDHKIIDENGQLLKLRGEIEGTIHELFVYDIKCITLEEELNNYFFKYNKTTIPNVRHLIGIPRTETQAEEILSAVCLAKKEYETKHYRLIDGTINGVTVKAENCVNGYYRSHKLYGVVNNPKPQLAAYGFFTHTLGVELRKKLLSGTNLEAGCTKEELENEVLQPIKPLV